MSDVLPVVIRSEPGEIALSGAVLVQTNVHVGVPAGTLVLVSAEVAEELVEAGAAQRAAMSSPGWATEVEVVLPDPVPGRAEPRDARASMDWSGLAKALATAMARLPAPEVVVHSHNEVLVEQGRREVSFQRGAGGVLVGAVVE